MPAPMQLLILCSHLASAAVWATPLFSIPSKKVTSMPDHIRVNHTNAMEAVGLYK